MAENNTVKERLISFIKYLNIGQGRFEARCGLANGYVNNIRRSITPDKLQQIALQFPDLNTGWLMTGEGEMLRADVDTTPQAEADAPAPAFGRVPLIPVGAFAGEVSGVAADGTDFSLCERVPSPVPGCDIAIDVSGDSMEPDFPNGCRVFCRRIDDEVFIAWGAVFVLDTCNGAFIKRLLPGPDDTCIEARSLNADYPPFRVPKSAIFGVYRVLASFRGYSAT